MKGRRRRRDPVGMGPMVGRVLGELGLEAVTAAFRVAEHWEGAVGPEVARHCRPVAVRDGVLEAEVVSSVWCQELQLQRPAILAALRRELGDDAPSDVRFRVGYSGPR